MARPTSAEEGPRVDRHVSRRLGAAVATAVIVLSLSASAAFAGEITGTGKSLKVEGGGKWGTGLHARSFCAFSGQEDLRYPPFSEPTAGHAQSWGQIPKSVRDEISQFGFHPGDACNPNVGPPPE
jgi:hypothetical protein